MIMAYHYLHHQGIEKISKSHSQYIKATNGNNLTNVIVWVLKQQTQVEEILNAYSIKFTEL